MEGGDAHRPSGEEEAQAGAVTPKQLRDAQRAQIYLDDLARVLYFPPGYYKVRDGSHYKLIRSRWRRVNLALRRDL